MKIKYESKVRRMQRERARALKAATAVPKPKTTSTERMRLLRARRKALLLDDEPICTGVDTSNVEPEIKVERDDDEGNPDKDVPSLEVNIKMEHEDEIKEEITLEENNFQCRICLSAGRKMSPLEEYEEIYKKLLFDIYPYRNEHIQLSTVLVCWECRAALRNVDRFQRKVRAGHDMLQTEDINVSLSTLTTVVFNDSNPGTIFLTEADKRTDNLNSENETNDNREDNDLLIEKEHQENRKGDNKGKSKKKFTRKRKMVIRKPKFKVVEGVETFKRVDFDLGVSKVLDEKRNDESCKQRGYKCSTCGLSFDDANELDDHNGECDPEVKLYINNINI
ncbi:uncharacterized protein LOC123666036 [Melitaea cinxia]|uniref:uncharacterized protein LOC123666036 n=1 Tax=Melitaea cinxia TaxID=113334 RepID=UPI001E273829|nr:uncharacterized protein LOC123666036 [Melitaea cinxia]